LQAVEQVGIDSECAALSVHAERTVEPKSKSESENSDFILQTSYFELPRVA